MLGLPRGGVPVAFEVADRLQAPLDVFVVRKLGLPSQPEVAFGAIASGGVRVLDHVLIARARITPAVVDHITARARAELDRQEALYRAGRAPLDLQGREVLLVDDGLATGSTMRAAVTAVRAHDPRRVIVAVPVGAPAAVTALRELADDLVCALTPEHFEAVGLWYDDFSATSDAEVRALLAAAADETPRSDPRSRG